MQVWRNSFDTCIYSINTNEIPGELSRKNMISSHMWKYHRAFHRIKLFHWNGLVFHWCLYNKSNIIWPLGDMKFLFSCSEIFSALEEKFHISARPCNILYMLDNIRRRQKNNDYNSIGCTEVTWGNCKLSS